MLKEYLEFADREVNANTRMIIAKLLQRFSKSHGLGPHSVDLRIRNNSEILPENFSDLIRKVVKVNNIKIIPPKAPGSASNKLLTFKINFDDNKEAIIVLSGPKSKDPGVGFEKSLEKRLQSKNPDAEIVRFFNMIGISKNDVASVKWKAKERNPRSEYFNIEKPQKQGREISDLVVTTKSGVNYFISAKQHNATYFYNSVNVPFIQEKINKNGDKTIVFVPEHYDPQSATAQIMKLFKIDINRLVKGLNSYGKKGRPTFWEPVKNVNKQRVIKILATAYGFGYYYVKEIQKDSKALDIVNFSSHKAVENFIGTITQIYIQYPGIKTKSTIIKINTVSKSTGQTNQFKIDFRNRGGVIVPLMLGMTKL